MNKRRRIRTDSSQKTPAVFRENAMLRQKVHELTWQLDGLESERVSETLEYNEAKDDWLKERQRADRLQKQIDADPIVPSQFVEKCAKGFFGA